LEHPRGRHVFVGPFPGPAHDPPTWFARSCGCLPTPLFSLSSPPYVGCDAAALQVATCLALQPGVLGLESEHGC
jgi:hypothetical protein